MRSTICVGVLVAVTRGAFAAGEPPPEQTEEAPGPSPAQKSPPAPAQPPQHEEPAEPEESEDEQGEKLAMQLTNPIADLVSIPFQFNWNTGVGPEHETQMVLNIQPVVPIHLTKDWNLIGRYIVPLIAQPTLGPGLEPTFGMGDIVFSMFLSPNNKSKFTWGLGPVFGLPGGTDPRIDSGKWMAGPTGVALYLDEPWTVGVLANQLWSIAGTGDVPRAKVSQMFVQPFVAFTKHKWTLTATSETTIDWEAADDNKWTIPLELQVSKVTKIGFLPFSVYLGGGWFADAPAGGPDWQLRLNFVVLLPSTKMIKEAMAKK